MKRKNAALCSLIAAMASLLVAKPPEPGCGTRRFRAQEERFLSQRHRDLRAKSGVARAELRKARDIGEIAVIDESGGVVARRNPFSLNRKTLSFEPEAAGSRRYRLGVGELAFDEEALRNGTEIRPLEDDGTQQLGLPFAFPFFGSEYRYVYINSDGNLTFGKGDAGNLDRSFGRLAGELPRIAALFTDLDPSRSGASILVWREAARVVITWLRVPLYSAFGFGARQTFQVALHADGRIAIAFDAIDTSEAVVGIAPGGVDATAQMVSMLTSDGRVFEGAFGERFTSSEQIDLGLAARRFYETHQDAYDFLVFYNAMSIPADLGAVAFEVTVRNSATGFGESILNQGADYGSARRLQAVANMGPLSQYPEDPNGIVPARALSGDTPLSILAHELGHRWLAYVRINDPRDPDLLLGRSFAHWNFNFHTDASFLEGNRIADLGEGIFTTTGAVQQYSSLDQYLMGLRSPGDVDRSFVVMASTISPSRAPQPFVQFAGIRRETRLEEIVEAHGPRLPDHTMAQRRFRVGFVLIAANAEPLASDVAKLEAVRARFEAYFAAATGNRAAMDTTLKRAVTLEGFPQLGVIVERTARFRLTLEQPAEQNATFHLTPAADLISTPPAAVIRAGESAAEFEVFGVQPGATDVRVRPEDPRFETLLARVNVTTLPFVTLRVAEGDRQLNVSPEPLPSPVVFAATDANQTAYANVPIRVEASSGGQVDPPEATTDGAGRASFRWRPGPGGETRLRAFIPGQPGSSAAAVAINAPGISGILNGASFVEGLSPGGYATIFGSSLAAGREAGASAPFPVKLGGTEVLVNGMAAMLTYVSDRQINFVVPAGLEPGLATLTVINEAVASGVEQVTIQRYAPGVFFDQATGFGAVLVVGTGLVTNQRPATVGEVVEIYCTGLGALVDGRTSERPRVRIGGVDAEVVFSGGSGGIPGLYQVNARVSVGTPSGISDLEVELGGMVSNRVKVRVF